MTKRDDNKPAQKEPRPKVSVKPEMLTNSYTPSEDEKKKILQESNKKKEE